MNTRGAWLAGGLLAGALLLSFTSPLALAQQTASSGAASSDNQALTAALSRLGRNPRDVDALIAAGNAALVSEIGRAHV